MSANRPYKNMERKIARLLGGQRHGHLGGADVVCDTWLSIECKHKQKLPDWLIEAVAQARRNASGSQLGVAILHQAGERHNGDLVIMRLDDFQDHFGPVEQE